MLTSIPSSLKWGWMKKSTKTKTNQQKKKKLSEALRKNLLRRKVGEKSEKLG